MSDQAKQQRDTPAPSSSEHERNARSPAPVFVPQYFFTVAAQLRRLQLSPFDARNPRGARLQVAYQSGDVSRDSIQWGRSWSYQVEEDDFKRKSYREDGKDKFRIEVTKPEVWQRQWNGLTGKVLGGGDFLLVRSDGVLELDGRVTIRADLDETVIDVVYRGVVDLAAHAKRGDDDLDRAISTLSAATRFERELLVERRRAAEARYSKAFEDFLNSRLELEQKDERNRPLLPLDLAVTFELASGPWSTSSGEDTSWISDRYDKLREHAWRYEPLTRGQFVARGEVRFAPFTPGDVPDAQSITLNVYRLRVPGREHR